MYISLRYLLASVFLTFQLINLQAKEHNNHQDNEEKIFVSNKEQEITLLNLDDQKLVAQQQTEVPFAYMPKSMQSVIKIINTNY